MEEKTNTTDKPSWDRVLNMVFDLTQQNANLTAELEKYHDSWATEVIEQQKDGTKWCRKIAIIILIGLLVTNAYWIHVFQSYDYISQDGNGVNSYKTEIQGDLVNGAEGQGEEER